MTVRHINALRTGLLHALAWFALLCGMTNAHAEDTVCARVKISLNQQLTLERQGFDATMTIANALDTTALTEVEAIIKVSEENGTPVLVTSDPNDTSARFFIGAPTLQGLTDVSGNGIVAAQTTVTADWLLIPAPGASGVDPLGKKYLIGATLKYKFGGEVQTVEVAPELVTVRPMPLLTLDYFLTRDVIGDDPLTAQVEAPEPFTLGVRVKNTGLAAATNLKIDSAQPKIVDNAQSLPIAFRITGSYVNDAPAQNSLLINFGTVAGNSAKMGRWVMESTTAGRFVDFSVRFSHDDALGGAVTSLLQATNAHSLIRDVRVDLPGRDTVRDFLAKDGDVLRVYESDSDDTTVQDVSATSSVVQTGSGYHLSLPPTQGFVYAQLPDPNHGSKALTTMVRADGKTLLAENLWLSRTQNATTQQWDTWINIFDVNTVGDYDVAVSDPPPPSVAPTIAPIADVTVKEGHQTSFIVQASGSNGQPVVLNASPLPSGAAFTAQAADPSAPGVSRALFDWTPAKGQAGLYLIVYSANDGILGATRSATVKVEVDTPPPGPATPLLSSPASGAQVTTLRPTLAVTTGADAADPTQQLIFEIYSDAAMTQQVATGTVAKPAGVTGAATVSFTPGVDLNDNTPYWWRARAYDGAQMYSLWVNGQFFVNQFNDAPETFNLTSPAAGTEVGDLQPTLSWTNSSDRDGDAISYRLGLYRDAALTDLVATVPDIQPGDGGAPSGSTGWVVNQPLTNHSTYYWRVVAVDAHGAETAAAARSFTVNTGNTAPTDPVINSPAVGGQIGGASVQLVVQNSVDAEGDAVQYVFELDGVYTFDSGAKRSSGLLAQGTGPTTSWTISGLVENQHYWWRVKALDGRAESAWVVGNFVVNSSNDAPPAPTIRNPGNGAWSATTQPTLEANPVIDPDGDAVTYRFQIFSNSTLSSLLQEGTSASGAWIVPTALADKTTYWWRVRAEDNHAAASAWSSTAVLYVSTGPYQDPTIQLLTPSTPVMPDANKKVNLSWVGVDPNIEPTIALYYGTSGSGYAGNLIVDGLRQAAGQQSGGYLWDTSALAPGAYYPYAAIYDAKGTGKAYSPGAVVIPPPVQSGSVIAQPTSITVSSYSNLTGTVQVSLGSAPTKNVTVPLSVSSSRGPIVSPSALTFTPQNWNVPQNATVTAQSGCSTALQSYSLLVGKAISLDPNYIGLSAPPVTVSDVNLDQPVSPTNIANVGICHLTQLTSKKVAGKWEYTYQAELTNGTTAGFGHVNAVAAVASPIYTTLFGLTVTESLLGFGSVAPGETVKSVDTITVRSSQKLPISGALPIDLMLKWTLTTQ